MKFLNPLLILLIIPSTLLSYQYYMDGHIITVYDTELFTKDTVKTYIDNTILEYQISDIAVFRTLNNEENFTINGKLLITDNRIIFDKKSHTIVGEIENAFSIIYDPKKDVFLGLLGGIQKIPGEKNYNNVIFGAYVFDYKKKNINKINFSEFSLRRSDIPGISYKSDENLLVVLTGENETSYYDFNDLNILLRVEKNEFWDYSPDAKFSCAGISQIKFRNAEGGIWNPVIDTNEYAMGWNSSKHYWMRDLNIYIVLFYQSQVLLFYPEEQNVVTLTTHGISTYMYDKSKDIFIVNDMKSTKGFYETMDSSIYLTRILGAK